MKTSHASKPLALSRVWKKAVEAAKQALPPHSFLFGPAFFTIAKSNAAAASKMSCGVLMDTFLGRSRAMFLSIDSIALSFGMYTASFSPSDVPFGMPLRSVMVHASLPRTTLAVISPSKVKLAYDERISRPLSLKLETIVSFAMRFLGLRFEIHPGVRPEAGACHTRNPGDFGSISPSPSVQVFAKITFPGPPAAADA